VSKIQRELGWSAKVSFEDGVKEMLENISYWSQAPVWTKESIGKATESWFRYLTPAGEKS